MMLKRITLLSDYKNIQTGSTLEFKQGYTALVGANGSGKSNWVEVVASVMLHILEGRPPGFGYRFFIDEHTEVQWQGSKLKYIVNQDEVDGNGLDLPKKLVVSYSGEDHRLWDDIMMDSYARYFKDKEMDIVGEPTAIYVNRYQWAIAMITLMCSNKPEVVDFVKTLWGPAVQHTDIQVKIDIEEDVTAYKDPDALKLIEQLRSENPLLISHIETFDIGVDPADNENFCRRLYYILYALSMPVPNSKRGIQTQKAITKIELSTNELDLSGLSEGHKKRILMMLMTQIIGDSDTIYLLDEPDAHVDVAAKSRILGLIEKAPGHVVLTTHSPLMTHQMKTGAVLTVKNGNTDQEEWKTVIEHLSDNQFASVNNFLFTLKRKVIITEGKYDVYYIRTAVNKLKANYPELEKLDDVALFSIGGTGDTKYFLENSLEPVIGYLEKVVMLFDKDGAGKGGFTETEKFVRDKGLGAKVEVLKYAKTYPDTATDDDFYVEDYFKPACYLNKAVNKNNITEFNLHGQPPYYEMKKMAQQSSTIKTFLENSYKTIEAPDYVDFLPLLRELITRLGL